MHEYRWCRWLPVRTDEPSVSAGRASCSADQRTPQHAAIFRRMPRLLDRVWDAPGDLDVRESRRMTDASQLGDLTISMLEGESGVGAKVLVD